MNQPPSLDTFNYDMNQYRDVTTPGEGPQFFGNFDSNGQPLEPGLVSGNYFDGSIDGQDENDPKRRRIARVRIVPSAGKIYY